MEVNVTSAGRFQYVFCFKFRESQMQPDVTCGITMWLTVSEMMTSKSIATYHPFLVKNGDGLLLGLSNSKELLGISG